MQQAGTGPFRSGCSPELRQRLVPVPILCFTTCHQRLGGQVMDRRTLEDLSAIAHRLWRERLAGAGWSSGPAFDPARRTHDALVDWPGLSRQDRRHARLGIEALELEEKLVSAIRYQRGPDREFVVEEMRQGLPVALS